jgi:hypothetical protein
MRLLLFIAASALVVAQTQIDSATQSRADFSGQTLTKPATVGNGAPSGTCSSGQIYFQSGAYPGQNLWLCGGGVWTQLIPGSGGGGGGGGTPNVSVATGILPIANGGNGTATPGLTTPGTGIFVAGSWPNYALYVGGIANYQLQNASVGVTLPGIFNGPSSVALGTTATWTMASQAAGKFLAGPANGSPAAAAFRSIALSDLPTLPTPTIPLGSSVSGVLPVANGGTGTSTPGLVQGNCISVTGTWPNQMIAFTCASGGGGGGGASSSAQLSDLATVLTNATTLTIAGGCSTGTPCNVRFGGATIPVTNSATITIPTGSLQGGTITTYLARDGSFQVISTVGPSPVTVSGATVSSNTQVPSDGIPLSTWTGAAGAWASTGTDLRAFISNRGQILAGTGIVVADASPGSMTISADTSVVAVRVAAPSTSSSACVLGNYAVDSSYFYQCVAANTWRRVASSTW